jgi:hypothetical protein
VSIIDSLRVLGAMARISAPSLVDIARNTLDRDTVDERARWFGRKVVELLGVDLVATGANQVPTDRAFVYMSNHQSHLCVRRSSFQSIAATPCAPANRSTTRSG